MAALLLAVLVARILLLPSGAIRAQERPPNIVFILADDLGYADLGSYGQKSIRTPNLDRLAAEGMRFVQAYSGSSLCATARDALMTGMQTGHTTIRDNEQPNDPLRDADVTVAEVLKQSGYVTAIIGKWGLGPEGTSGAPNRQGFDEFYGYLDQLQAHDYYPEFLWHNQHKVILHGNLGGKQREYSPDLFTQQALAFLTQHDHEPFFLYLAYTLPHQNSQMGDRGWQVPSDEPYSRESWPQPKKNVAAMITNLDTDVGKIMGRLRSLGIDRDTIVFFSSDNGPPKGERVDWFKSNGQLRGGKRGPYESGIRVPMIVRWPNKIAAGRTSDQVWAFWDFLPTAAELARGHPPRSIDGLSIVPALMGRPQRNHHYLYWELPEERNQAIRMGDWKGVRRPFGWDPMTQYVTLLRTKLELYDLRVDPGERHDVAAEHPDVVRFLEAAIQEAESDRMRGARAPDYALLVFVGAGTIVALVALGLLWKRIPRVGAFTPAPAGGPAIAFLGSGRRSRPDLPARRSSRLPALSGRGGDVYLAQSVNPRDTSGLAARAAGVASGRSFIRRLTDRRRSPGSISSRA